MKRDDKIVIRYYVAPNENVARGGFMPLIEVNGRQRGDTFGTGYDRDEAMVRAEARALEKASRYTGDWQITVRQADDKYARAAAKRLESHYAKQRSR
jgi:hypothetical protein